MEFLQVNKENIFLVLGALTIAKYLMDTLVYCCTRKDNRMSKLLSEVDAMKGQNLVILEHLDLLLEKDRLAQEYQDQDSQDNQTQYSQDQGQETQDSQEQQTQEEAPVANYTTENIVDEISKTPLTQAQKLDEKHKRLLSKLQPNTEVYMSYKKTTFTAKFVLKPSAPHGYVFEAGSETFQTPTQFSFKRKHTLNPEISSDNGWDTVYVITGKTDKNKDIKKSLNELIC